jgi:hypothetical protein
VNNGFTVQSLGLGAIFLDTLKFRAPWSGRGLDARKIFLVDISATSVMMLVMNESLVVEVSTDQSFKLLKVSTIA